MTTDELEFKNYLGNWEPLTRIVVSTEIRVKPEPPKPREGWVSTSSIYQTQPASTYIRVREVIE